MENKEDVHSDDGSYDVIDFNDEMEHMSINDDVDNNKDHSDGSYDFLSSEEEATKSDSTEEEEEEEEEEEDDAEEDKEFSGMDFPDHVDKGKKRNFMAAFHEDSEMPGHLLSHIELKEDSEIKEVAKKHILRYLPAKTLTKFKLINKEWNQWISSPFLKHQQSQYFKRTSGFFEEANGSTRFISLDESAYGVPNSLYFLPYKADIKSSSNGLLLCQATLDENSYYVCNPASKKWIKIPNSSYYHGETPKIVIAIEPSSLNFEPFYQIICPFSLPMEEGPIVYFDIYDSQTNAWKISEMVCVNLHESNVKSDGIYVNGIVYWETTGGELLAFDLENEIYSVQELPFTEGGALTKVNGELSYVRGYYDYSMRRCRLEVYGGGIMSLKNTMDFDVYGDEIEEGEIVDCRIVSNTCDDVVAVMVKKSQGLNRLFVYHVEDGKVEGPWITESDNKLFPYINSFVSLPAYRIN